MCVCVCVCVCVCEIALLWCESKSKWRSIHKDSFYQANCIDQINIDDMNSTLRLPFSYWEQPRSGRLPPFALRKSASLLNVHRVVVRTQKAFQGCLWFSFHVFVRLVSGSLPPLFNLIFLSWVGFAAAAATTVPKAAAAAAPKATASFLYTCLQKGEPWKKMCKRMRESIFPVLEVKVGLDWFAAAAAAATTTITTERSHLLKNGIVFVDSIHCFARLEICSHLMDIYLQ